jgi:hypothetical protein
MWLSVERVRVRMALTRSMDTPADANCRPDVTCPVNGVLALETKGRAMAFLVSLMLSRNSMAAKRPMPRKRRVLPVTSFQVICSNSLLAFARRVP